MVVAVPDHLPGFSFDATTPPALRVASGASVRFATGDAAYADIDGGAIDTARVDFQRANALSGPVYVEGAQPGDALGFKIEGIEVDKRAFAVYVRRWRSGMFGLPESRVVEVEIDADGIRLPTGGRIAIEPMVGCIGVAPAYGTMSSLGPTGRTGGNMDLIEIRTGTTVWLPVEAKGGLFSLGDIHARMGRGEPLGSGLECGGGVVGNFILAPEVPLHGPVLHDKVRVSFVGTSSEDWRDAERVAVRAAWDWLTGACGVPDDDAIVLSAALLDVNAGGPAGNNVVATLLIDDLVVAGIAIDVWPIR